MVCKEIATLYGFRSLPRWLIYSNTHISVYRMMFNWIRRSTRSNLIYTENPHWDYYLPWYYECILNNFFFIVLLLQDAEAANEAERLRLRLEKELEIARLRAQQERASDEAAKRDELRAKRAAEEAERECRRKEIAEAKKKKEIENELKNARGTQAEEARRRLAIEVARERLEFERILK